MERSFKELNSMELNYINGGDVNKISDVAVGGLGIIGGISMLFIPGFRVRGVVSALVGITTIFAK